MATHHIYPLANPDASDADTRVSLQWMRDGDVRVATAKLAPGVDRDREYMDGADPREAWEGVYVPLDRGQCNHLIKQLRTARDQAYGRDE